MRPVFLKVALLFLVLAFAGGLSFGFVFANNSSGHSCCNSPCHASTTCHAAAKTCLCSYHINQAALCSAGDSLKLIYAGSLIQSPQFAYLYLSSEDIFHPPRA